MLSLSSGLPIAYSNRRPMTDILQNDGVVFEPKAPVSIVAAILKLLENDEFRYCCALGAYSRALAFSWERTARETYHFIRQYYYPDDLVKLFTFVLRHIIRMQITV